MGKPVPSTHTFMVDGAVPYAGDLLSQVALLVEVHLSVPPPVLLMDRYALDPHERVLEGMAG
jgi:hypothetical protein